MASVWLALGVWGVVVGASLPWLSTGAVQRSAFGVARSARLLGLADAPERRLALVLLFATPMLGGAVLVALSLGWRRIAALIASTVGVVGVVGAVVGSQLPGDHEIGPIVSGCAGVVSILGSVVAAITSPSKGDYANG